MECSLSFFPLILSIWYLILNVLWTLPYALDKLPHHPVYTELPFACGVLPASSFRVMSTLWSARTKTLVLFHSSKLYAMQSCHCHLGSSNPQVSPKNILPCANRHQALQMSSNFQVYRWNKHNVTHLIHQQSSLYPTECWTMPKWGGGGDIQDLHNNHGRA